jgi:hypothetical protein
MTVVLCGPAAIAINGASDELIKNLNSLFFWEVTQEEVNTLWSVTIVNQPLCLVQKQLAHVKVEFNEMALLYSYKPRVIEILSTRGQIAIHSELKEAEIFNLNPRGLFVDTYRLIRQLMIYVLKQKGFFCLHAGTVSRNGRGFALVGDKGAGKTSNIAYLAATYGYDLVSNDKLFVHPNGVAVHFPEAPAVTIQTLRSIPNLSARMNRLCARSPKGSDLFLDHPPLPSQSDFKFLQNDLKIFFSESEFALFLGAFGRTVTSLVCIAQLTTSRFSNCIIESGVKFPLDYYSDSLDSFHDWTGLREKLQSPSLIFRGQMLNVHPASSISETASTLATYFDEHL